MFTAMSHTYEDVHICNKRPEAYSEHSQACKKEFLQKSYQLKAVGGS